MSMDDNEWKTKGIKIKTKDKIEPQRIHCSLMYNMDFGLSGVAVEGIEMSTMQKGCHFMGMSQHFCQSLSECKIVLRHRCWLCDNNTTEIKAMRVMFLLLMVRVTLT